MAQTVQTHHYHDGEPAAYSSMSVLLVTLALLVIGGFFVYLIAANAGINTQQNDGSLLPNEVDVNVTPDNAPGSTIDY